MKTKLSLIEIGMISILLLVIVGFYLDVIKPDKIQNKTALEQDVFYKVNQTKSFYNYSLENCKKEYNESILISKGGCCWQWSEYYGNYFKKGYNTTQVKFPYGEKRHQVVIISSKEGYCLIDGTNYYCKRMK